MPVFYHIGEHQMALPRVTVTPRSYEHSKGESLPPPPTPPPGYRSGLIELNPGTHTSSASTRSHAYRYTSTLPLFTLDSLCLFVFYLMLSDSNTCQQRSTGHDLSQQLGTKKERRRAADGCFILLMQTF